MKDVGTFEIKPSPREIVVTDRILVVLAGFVSLLALIGQEIELVWIAVGVSFFSFTHLIWLRSLHIAVDEGGLSYTSMFRKVRNLQLCDIESVEIEVGRRKWIDGFYPVFRLVIMPAKRRRMLPIVLDIRAFSKSDVLKLLELLDVREDYPESLQRLFLAGFFGVDVGMPSSRKGDLE